MTGDFAARLDGARALVVGLGASGIAAARALRRHGAAVLAVDEQDSAVTRAAAERAEAAGIVCVLGPLDAALVERVDLVVPSPGVPEHHPVLAAAAARGLPLRSEPGLAWELAEPSVRLLAVTGTNGKTTTTELLAACLGAPAAGNIGTPLTDLLDPRSDRAVTGTVVAELSSFQLRFAGRLRPKVAALLNLAEDHLDWHRSYEAYEAAKAAMWAHQREDDELVVNADDGGVAAAIASSPPQARVTTFTLDPPGAGQVGVDAGMVVSRLGDEPLPVVAVDDLHLGGRHNLANVAAAVAAALRAGADPATLAAPLRGQRPGAHRLEPVAEAHGVRWVDDSKATNPHAAAAALASFDRVVWIAGGLGKGLDFASLRDDVARHVRIAVTIGEAGPQLATLARDAGVEVVDAGTLDVAVDVAARIAVPGDVVLLAPACASMDQFRNYAERGRAFRDAVTKLLGAQDSCGQELSRRESCPEESRRGH